MVILEHYSGDGLQPLDRFTKSDTEARGSGGDHTNTVAIDIADEVNQENKEHVVNYDLQAWINWLINSNF